MTDINCQMEGFRKKPNGSGPLGPWGQSQTTPTRAGVPKSIHLSLRYRTVTEVFTPAMKILLENGTPFQATSLPGILTFHGSTIPLSDRFALLSPNAPGSPTLNSLSCFRCRNTSRPYELGRRCGSHEMMPDLPKTRVSRGSRLRGETDGGANHHASFVW